MLAVALLAACAPAAAATEALPARETAAASAAAAVPRGASGGPAPGHPLVGRVRVEGARLTAAADILGLLGLDQGAPCDTSALPGRAERVVAACAAEGLLDARVRVSWRLMGPGGEEASGAGGRDAGEPGGAAPAGAVPALDVTVQLDEGEPWRVGEVRQVDAMPEVLESVGRRLEMKTGARWMTSALEADVERLLAAYDEAGHPWARVRPGKLEMSNGRVSVTITHEPGPPMVLEALTLNGARATRPRTAERAMGFVPGRPYRQSRLEEGLERLRASGLFAEVGEAFVEPGTDPSTGRLLLSVREGSTGSVSGIVGYSGADRRLAGDLDFRLRNIAGTGRQARARWSSREKGSTIYLLSYREPWLLGTALDLSLDLEHVLYDTLYTRTRTDLALTWRAGSRLTAVAGAGRDRVVVSSTVQRSEGSFRARAGLAYDARDSKRAPTRGFDLELEAQRGKTLAGLYGDLAGAPMSALTVTGFHGEFHQPVGGRRVAALILNARTLDTRALPVPQYELFPLGGATTLRGYREEQFYTPGYLLAQLEYRLGVGPAGSGAYLFLDTAVFSAAGAEARWWPKTTESRTGYGAGIRVGSQLGRVGVEYGLATGESPLDGRIHLRIEAEF